MQGGHCNGIGFARSARVAPGNDCALGLGSPDPSCECDGKHRALRIAQDHDDCSEFQRCGRDILRLNSHIAPRFPAGTPQKTWRDRAR